MRPALCCLKTCLFRCFTVVLLLYINVGLRLFLAILISVLCSVPHFVSGIKSSARSLLMEFVSETSIKKCRSAD